VNDKRNIINKCRAAVVAACCAVWALAGAQTVTLDECRQMAINNNKSIRQADLSIEKAGYQRKEAHAAYFPSIDLEAGYVYNSRKLSLVEDDQYLPIKTFNLSTGSYDYSLVTNPLTGELVTNNGSYIPATVALLPKSALTYNVHNVMFGALSLTQPLYMGGKITAMNQITKYAEELAQQMHDSKVEDIIYDVDAAYWQVVSLRAKQRLAKSYVELIEKLDGDVKSMVAQGVATRANQLTVDVKLNEANVDLTRVDNGVTLARMALAQLCGLPVNTQLTLADENREDLGTTLNSTNPDLNDVYARRHDVQALQLATKIYDQQAKVARSEMMPKVAAIAALHVMNPNTYNGFKNRFGAGFSVGVTLKMPIWHWGGLTAKFKAAQVDAQVKQLELDEAKEKIALQVSQASFRYQEAIKTYEATKANLAQADENMRIANVGFHEGVATIDDVLTAQTAWLKANSEKIDAEIDVRLCDVYLSKVTGNMSVQN